MASTTEGYDSCVTGAKGRISSGLLLNYVLQAPRIMNRVA